MNNSLIAIIVAIIGVTGSITTALIRSKGIDKHIKDLKEEISKIWNYINDEIDKNNAVTKLYSIKDYYKEKYLKNDHCKSTIDIIINSYIQLFSVYYDSIFDLEKFRLYQNEFRSITNKIKDELKVYCKQEKTRNHFYNNLLLIEKLHFNSMEDIYFSSYNKKLSRRYEEWKKLVKEMISVWSSSIIQDCPYKNYTGTANDNK